MSNYIPFQNLSVATSMLAPGPGMAAQQANSVSTAEQIDQLKIPDSRVNQVAEAQNQTTGYFIETYPNGLDKFYMRMDFKKYKRPSPVLPGMLDSLHSICLPIPTFLNDAYSIEYSSYDAEIFGAMMTSVSGNTPNYTLSGLGYAAQTLLRGTIGKNIQSIASQSLAMSLNPHKTMLFNSTNFKTYEFSWTFAPNSPEESATIRKIINLIKRSSLPTYNGSGNTIDYNIFNYPNMVKISLYPWAGISKLNLNNLDKEMFQTKHCVIESINVTYSPENNVSFFNSSENSPTFVSLDLRLTEIELFTAEDFGASSEFVAGAAQGIYDVAVNVAAGVDDQVLLDTLAVLPEQRPAFDSDNNFVKTEQKTVEGQTLDFDLGYLRKDKDGNWYYFNNLNATVQKVLPNELDQYWNLFSVPTEKRNSNPIDVPKPIKNDRFGTQDTWNDLLNNSGQGS